jgi:glycosyltransferase involved in cell wall biosynthesis
VKDCIIIAPAYPLRGGIASSTERLAYELKSHGYEVTIYTFSLQYPSIFFPGKTQYSEDPPPKGLNIKVKLNSINPINWWEVGKEISKLKPDLVITRFWIPFMAPSIGSVLRLIKRNKPSKTIAIVDNIIPHEKRIGDRSLSAYFINSVDAFIVMSRSVGEEIKQFSATKPQRYIPHPNYDNYGKAVSREQALSFLKLDPKYNYLLFFGFIRDYKGLDLLIKALNDERIKKMPLRLIVAGEYYADEAKYLNLIRSEDVENQVILKTEFIPNEEVKYYFCATDLVVQPYKTATQSGISQLAFFYDKPMLATNVGGLPEIIDHQKSGYIVEVEPSAIADAIVDFFQNNRAESFIKEVIENKKKYSWENMVRGIEELMTEI